jgi:hypothetical protein
MAKILEHKQPETVISAPKRNVWFIDLMRLSSCSHFRAPLVTPGPKTHKPVAQKHVIIV